MKKLPIPIVALLALFSSCPGLLAQSAAWPMFRHDPAHTGRSSFVGSVSGALL